MKWKFIIFGEGFDCWGTNSPEVAAAHDHDDTALVVDCEKGIVCPHEANGMTAQNITEAEMPEDSDPNVDPEGNPDVYKPE